MKPETIASLDALNLRFYEERAEEFSSTREKPWPGWDRVLGYLPIDRSTPFRVLDIGCGNARFARYLRERLPRTRRLIYDGIDASAPLVAIARKRLAGRGIEASFRITDTIMHEPERVLPPGPYDLVVMFGFLHHVPGFDTRLHLFDAALSRLKPGGLLAATWWRFNQYERFEKRILPWQEAEAQRFAPGLREEDLEPGDHLLAWGDAQPAEAARYCHFSTDDERRLMREALVGEMVQSFGADGPDGAFNHYWVLRASTIRGSVRRGTFDAAGQPGYTLKK